MTYAFFDTPAIHEIPGIKEAWVERRRFLLFPVEADHARQAYLSRRPAERVGRTIRGGRPVGHLHEDVRVLAAPATAARLKTVARDEVPQVDGRVVMAAFRKGTPQRNTTRAGWTPRSGVPYRCSADCSGEGLPTRNT
ncbi:hypothetical protein [Nonomuraea roseola]|uniref:Uncharacterized protein n=1 Tax=Nonomuraea roseola TaxID=46179 RepID=A0ABV5Q490_9ACTN